MTRLGRALLPLLLFSAVTAEATAQKDWTILVFLNGFNNLDSFGYDDLNEMEAVGTNDRMNIVVQWASLERRDVRRMLVTRDSDPNTVNSIELSNLGIVDMGDWRELAAFVEWGVQNYPAKHIFIDVWNHGGGWHRSEVSQGPGIRDISFDDISGNKITTDELGRAISQARNTTGRRFDILGMDACLMAMAEVGDEVADSVDWMVASQDLEPGAGWAYDDWLASLQGAYVSPARMAQALVDTYHAAYTGGSEGEDEVTLSAVDLTAARTMRDGIALLAQTILQLPSGALLQVRDAARSATRFFSFDYVDLGDWIKEIQSSAPAALREAAFASALTRVKQSLGNAVTRNAVTEGFEGAQGLSIWLPTSAHLWNEYRERYQLLEFEKKTGWSQAIAKMMSFSSSGESRVLATQK